MMRVWLALALWVGMALSMPWPELAETPPMGWNGWLTAVAIRHPANRSETVYYEAADLLVSTGLRDAGYVYVRVVRDENGKLQPNSTTWPRGIPALADYLHARGLKLGLYADTGKINCCNEPGQYEHEEEDVAQFVSWGCDHITIDNCGNPFGNDHSRDEYVRMLAAIEKVGHPMTIAVYNGGMGRPWTWAREIGHYWRTGTDLGNKFLPDEQNPASVMFNYDLQQSVPNIADYAGPGGWNMLDNMVIGLPPNVPHHGDTGLTDEEARTHFSLWSIMASPLIIDADLRGMPQNIINILANPEVIAVNQDRLGKQGVRVDVGLASYRPFATVSPPPHGTTEVLARPLEGGDWAAVLFNRAENAADITLHFPDLVRDLWKRQDLGVYNSSFPATAVPPHGCRMLRLRPCQ